MIGLPPLIYGIGLASALLLNWLWPSELLPGVLTLPVGLTICLLAGLIAIGSFRAFAKAGTNVDVKKPATAIVTAGPYSISRNPMYLALTLLLAGIGILANTFWVLAILPPVLVVVEFGVIRREEVYLENKFGEGYLQYKRSVRRWL